MYWQTGFVGLGPFEDQGSGFRGGACGGVRPETDPLAGLVKANANKGVIESPYVGSIEFRKRVKGFVTQDQFPHQATPQPTCETQLTLQLRVAFASYPNLNMWASPLNLRLVLESIRLQNHANMKHIQQGPMFGSRG